MQFSRTQIHKLQQVLKARFNVDLSPKDTEWFAIAFAELMGLKRKPRKDKGRGKSFFRVEEWINNEWVETPWVQMKWEWESIRPSKRKKDL